MSCGWEVSEDAAEPVQVGPDFAARPAPTARDGHGQGAGGANPLTTPINVMRFGGTTVRARIR